MPQDHIARSLQSAPPEPGAPLPYLPQTADLMANGGRGEGEADGAQLLRLLFALKRFRWLIAGLTLAGLGGGFVATQYIEPLFQVGATIWIETERAGGVGSPIQGDRLLESRAWVELLRTYKVLDPVVRQQKLYLHAAVEADSVLFRDFDLADRFLPGEYTYTVSGDGRTYSLNHRTRQVADEGQVGDSVGRNVGFRWVPRPARAAFGQEIRFEVLTPREASVSLAGRLESTLREENFLSLRLAGPDPERTASTLNALITRFVDEAATQKRQKLTLLSEVLDSQVLNQAEKLRSAEETLEGFRVGTVTLPRDQTPVAAGLQFTEPTVYGEYFNLRTQRDAIVRDRQAIEAVLDRAKTGAMATDAFNTIPSVKNAPDLLLVLGDLSRAEASLRDSLTRYTEEYKGVKDLRAKINDLRTRTIPVYANALIVQLKLQENDFDSRIAIASSELRLIPSRSQTEARMTREQQQADALYRSLENSRQQARLAEASAIPDVRIVDSAVVPTRPSKNSAPSLILMGLLAGLGLGVGLALLFDRLDRRVRYPEQVSQGLGLAILGTIPQIRNAANGSTSGEDAAQVIESFRSVRLNLSHTFAPGAPMTLAISSPSPGDGKSLISANLALSFAEAGYRTLLIDGDTRRGDLHRTFTVERCPGLIDHLMGTADQAGILRPTSHPRLMLLPSGTRRRDGPELLGSARMQDLITVLKTKFDVIVIDTPPLGAGIDPFVLGTTVGNIALILRAGETDRQLAEAKLQVLDRLPVRLLGAILNDVRLGHGAYRYYSYNYGYLPTEEEEERPASLPTPSS